MKKVRETFGVSRIFSYLCTSFLIKPIITNIMTPTHTVTRRSLATHGKPYVISVNSKEATLRYCSSLGRPFELRLSRADISRAASEAFTKVVIKEKK